MRDTICQITAQYYENYSDSATPYWKPKGSHMFTVMVDSDDFCYAEDVCISTIMEMLKSEGNNHEKFEYVSHELIFQKPTELSIEKFEQIFSVKAKEYYQTELVDSEGKETNLGKIVDEGDYELDEF